MTFVVTVIAGLSLVMAAVVQLVISRRFRDAFLARKVDRLPAHWQSKAVVLVCVRGLDPSLETCLRGVLAQDYRDFEVHVVVDHEADPAWPVLKAIKAKYDTHDRLQFQTLSNRLATCSLKCSSLVQAVKQLDEQGDRPTYVALVDADVTPHSTWLAELLSPFQRSTTGAVTGNQWFEPPAKCSFGSLGRSVWNGGGMILALFFSNPWAGSLAMRFEDLLQSGLVDDWSKSAVDDGPIADAVHRLGKRVVVAPSLVMVNREQCTLSFFLRWTTRMLTWSRIHERTFWITILHAFFSNFVMLFSFACLLVNLLAVEPWGIAVSLLSLVTSGILSAQAYNISRQCVQHSCRQRNEELADLPGGRFRAAFWMIAPAHLVYGFACLRAMTLRRIQWRGVSYQLGKQGKFTRLDYSPFKSDEKPSSHSI